MYVCIGPKVTQQSISHLYYIIIIIYFVHHVQERVISSLFYSIIEKLFFVLFSFFLVMSPLEKLEAYF